MANDSQSSLIAQGNKYYNEKNYSQALECYLALSGKSDSDVQLYIGNCYAFVAGAEKSDEKAAYWFTRAAAQGSAMARENLRRLKSL